MTNLMQTLIDGASLGSLYALVALAIGLVFGIMRLINFVQGDYIAIGGYALIVPTAAATPTLLIGAWPAPAMVAAITLIVVAVAILTERLAFRPLRETSAATLLISSFSLSYLLQHLILLIYSSKPKAIGLGASLAEPVVAAGLRIPKIQILTMATTVVLLVGLGFFLKRTDFGVQMRAAAEDFRMARLLGVRANAVIAVAFAISGALGAIVSLLLVVQVGILDYQMGVLPVIYAFFATVIGGMGSLTGAALGGFIVGFTSQVLQALLPDTLRPFRDAFVFAVVILILLFRPHGLLALRSSMERV
jgi:branched-chain amino acid transport system permease protein